MGLKLLSCFQPLKDGRKRRVKPSLQVCASSSGTSNASRSLNGPQHETWEVAKPAPQPQRQNGNLSRTPSQLSTGRQTPATPSRDHELTISVARTASDASSDAAWVLGRSSMLSSESFCSARSASFSSMGSAVSNFSEVESMRFWTLHDTGPTPSDSSDGGSVGGAQSRRPRANGSSSFQHALSPESGAQAAVLATRALLAPPGTFSEAALRRADGDARAAQQLPSRLQQRQQEAQEPDSWQEGRGDTCDSSGSDVDSIAGAGAAAEDITRLLRLAEAAHAEGRLVRVRDLLRQAAALQGCTFAELMSDGFQMVLDGASCAINLEQLRQDLDLVHLSIEDAQDYSDFSSSSCDGLDVLYRHVRGTGVHSFRFEATYDCPVSHLLAVTREFDLLSTWNKMALDPAVLSEVDMFTNIVYTGQWMPFPLSELDLVVRTQWCDLKEEEDALLITLSDSNDAVSAPGMAKLPKKSAKRKRIQLLAGSSSILQPAPSGPDGRPRTRCLVLAHLNPHVPSVPRFIIQFVLKVLSPFLYKATKDLLANAFQHPDQELPKRMAASSELYEAINRRFVSPPHGSPEPKPIGRCLTTSFKR